ncbi:DUF4062 domain-containing protein [Vibrio natriegens]|uniref:DUF4062 domain-containing protein n=1 Tax=Vibrio natriegens TaxID=691 RepID=UPI003F834C10
MNLMLPQNEIRVFLSSTFKDMDAERDYLLTHVFPEIRNRCSEYGIGFTDVDLRWGITEEESSNGQAVDICLREIDHCREYPPFFIGFLGERYGWIPEEGSFNSYFTQECDEVSQSVLNSLNEQQSVTELEFQYALKDNQRGELKTLFYFRSPQLTSLLYENAQSQNINISESDFYQPGPTVSYHQLSKLDVLKQRIRDNDLVALDNYQSIAEFGEHIKHVLLENIQERFSAKKSLEPWQLRRLQHDAFAHHRRHSYIVIPEIQNLVVCAVKENLNGVDKRIIVIQGESGIGKSSLMAHLTTHLQSEVNTEHTLAWYAGAEGNNSLESWRDDLIAYLGSVNQSPMKKSAQVDDPWDVLMAELAQTTATRPVILLLDALNQLENVDQVMQQIFMQEWPTRVVIVVSTTPEVIINPGAYRSIQFHRSMMGGYTQVLLESFLKRYQKKLSPSQAMTIAKHKNCLSPLYLRLLLEHMRVFAKHEALDNEINRLLNLVSSDLLFADFLNKLDSLDIGIASVNIAHDLSEYLSLSYQGLSEEKLAHLLSADKDDKLPAALLSPVLHQLWPFLRRNEGRISLQHQALYPQNIADAHEKQIKIKELCQNNLHDIAEYLHQLNQLKNKESIIATLSVPKNVNRLVEQAPTVVNKSLILIDASSQDSASLTTPIILAWQKIQEDSFSENVGNFLLEFGYWKLAEAWIDQLIYVGQAKVSDDSQNRVSVLQLKARLSETLGQYVEAESEYWQCHRLLEKHLEKSDDRIATSLLHLANLYETSGRYLQAEELALKAYDITLDESQIRLEALSKVTTLLCVQQRITEAELYANHTLSYARKYYPASDVRMVPVLHNVANVFKAQRKLKNAKDLCIEAFEILKLNYPIEHPSIALAVIQIADKSYSQGQYENAEALLRDGISVLEAVLPENHYLLTLGLKSLATVLEEHGWFIETEALYRRAISIIEDNFQMGHPEQVLLMYKLGRILQLQDKMIDEVESLYRQALALYEGNRPASENSYLLGETLSADQFSYSECSHSLIRLLEQQGRDSEAIAIKDKLEQMASSPKVDTEAIEFERKCVMLTQMALEYRDFSRAESACREALICMEKRLPVGDILIIQHLYLLSSILQKMGYEEEADVYIQRVLFLKKPRRMFATESSINEENNYHDTKKVKDSVKSTSSIFKTEGEFGFSVDNPILVESVAYGYYYLENLRFVDGQKVRYSRIGSTSSKCFFTHPVDVYAIYSQEGDEICKIHIWAYSDVNSTEKPDGFM